MNLPPDIRWSSVGFGLVAANMLLSWIVGIVTGGFKIGSLERRVTHRISREQAEVFRQRMQERMAQLGFRTSGVEGTYVQSGSELGDLSSFTHARTQKELRVNSDDEGQMMTVQLSLRYLDPIVGDSGESAYRDAVLDYVSGQTDEMKVVPNRSYAALSSFLGGLLGWGALFGLTSIQFKPVLQPILVLAVTEIVLAVLALIAIGRRPGELTGRGLAVAGIALSTLAVVGAVILA